MYSVHNSNTNSGFNSKMACESINIFSKQLDENRLLGNRMY